VQQPPAPPKVPKSETPQLAAQTGSSGGDLPPSLQELRERLATNERGLFITTDPILFNTNKATLRPVSNQALEKLADLLKQGADIKLQIIGHTDNLGVEAVNKKLSAERAAAVRDYLVSRGIDPSRLGSKGMGSTSPVAANDSRLGRQANRRIEFLVTSPK
jgi:outer membrane protein OmpA-like peptidoglycan-associated protein